MLVTPAQELRQPLLSPLSPFFWVVILPPDVVVARVFKNLDGQLRLQDLDALSDVAA